MLEKAVERRFREPRDISETCWALTQPGFCAGFPASPIGIFGRQFPAWRLTLRHRSPEFAAVRGAPDLFTAVARAAPSIALPTEQSDRLRLCDLRLLRPLEMASERGNQMDYTVEQMFPVCGENTATKHHVPKILTSPETSSLTRDRDPPVT